MIWLICAIGGLTALFFIINVWSKWTDEAINAGAYCPKMPVEEDYSHRWEVGTCENCHKSCEVYIPEMECNACLTEKFFYPQDPQGEEVEADGEMKRLRKRCIDLESQILLLEARIHWLGSNPFGN